MADETANEEVKAEESKAEIDKKYLEADKRGEIALEFEEGVEEPETTESPKEHETITLDGKEMTADDVRQALRDSENKKEWQKKQTERDQELAKTRKELDKELAKLRESVKGDDALEQFADKFGNTSKEVITLKEELAEIKRVQEYEKSRNDILKMKRDAEKELGYELPDIDSPEFKAYVEFVQSSNPILLAAKLKGAPAKSSEAPENLKDSATEDEEVDPIYAETLKKMKELGVKNPKAFIPKRK